MAEDRPHPPSPRRRGLARQSGLSAASPLLVGAVAVTAGVLALGVLGGAIASRLGTQIADACAMGGTSITTPDLLGSLSSALDTAIELALPLATVIAVAAIAGQIAQTRSIWMPRRRIDGAPSMPADIGARTRRASLELIHALAIGGVGAGWLWWAAPRIAALPMVPLAAAALVSSALATLAIAWLVIGVIDALLRHAAVGRALRMTTTEKRDDDRLSSVDPRWRRLARQLAAEPDPRAQLATATLLILGDDAAVAIAFDPRRQPIPSRVAVGRGVRATQLVALARRYRLAIHREPALASALVRGTGPVPEAHWPRLAELVAATRR